MAMEIQGAHLSPASLATLRRLSQKVPAEGSPQVTDSVLLGQTQATAQETTGSSPTPARPATETAVGAAQEVGSWAETLRQVDKFKGAFLILGFGSKGQYQDPEAAKHALDRQADQFDAEYGKGRWLAVFGGDPYKADAPDVAHLVRHLQETRAVTVMALQSDKVKEWGGVDKEIDLVHYVPTTTGADGKIVWGGFVDGKPAGPTAAYLGEDFIGGQNPRLKGVVAVGGGEIAGQEAQYARQHGIPVHYIRAEARFDVPGGKYGAIDSMIG